MRLIAVAIAAVVTSVVVSGCGPDSSRGGGVSPGSAGPAAEKDDAAGGSTTATWGERYTWDDGLAVELGTPEPCEPSASAYPDGIERAVKVPVTVVNGTAEEFNTGQLVIGGEAQFDGRKAEDVADVGGPCGEGMDMGATVLPGKTFTTDWVIAVGAKPGELQLVLQPTFDADKAIYVGKA